MAQVSARYARALFNLVKERELDPRRFLEVFDQVKSLFEMPEAAKILKSPVMPSALKLEVLSYALEKSGAEEYFFSIIKYLIENKREAQIPKIVDSFRKILDESQGIFRGDLISSVELNGEEQAELAVKLGQLLNKQVILESKVDKTVLGGFVAKIGQYLIDQSLKSKLDGLEQYITSKALRS